MHNISTILRILEGKNPDLTNYIILKNKKGMIQNDQVMNTEEHLPIDVSGRVDNLDGADCREHPPRGLLMGHPNDVLMTLMAQH